MGFIQTVEKDINIAETWITNAADEVGNLLKKVEGDAAKAAPQLAAAVTATQDFLAAATPAVAGEGLNFPADSVAYAKFVALVAAWQALGSTVITDVKALKS